VDARAAVLETVLASVLTLLAFLFNGVVFAMCARRAICCPAVLCHALHVGGRARAFEAAADACVPGVAALAVSAAASLGWVAGSSQTAGEVDALRVAINRFVFIYFGCACLRMSTTSNFSPPAILLIKVLQNNPCRSTRSATSCASLTWSSSSRHTPCGDSTRHKSRSMNLSITTRPYHAVT
jgi:hypothetical protein